MATAAATAASSMAHQIPPMPRIRPPRMLKGEPHPNNAPVPREQLPSQRKMIWVQGKYRSAGSRAVGSRQATHDIQIAKALRHQTRGLDIYAYRHIRTNQVVYSLTRTLQVLAHSSDTPCTLTDEIFYTRRTRSLNNCYFMARKLCLRRFATTCGLLTSQYTSLPRLPER